MLKTEQMKSLKLGNGIQYLLDEAHKILGNPINTFNTDYNLIAYTDVPSDDSLWIELITEGTFSVKSQIFFMEECFTDVVASAKTLALMKSDKLKYDRILGHIRNADGIKVANALMLECSQKFDNDTVSAFEILVGLLTQEISNDESFVAYGKTWQNNMIKRLIDCDLENNGLYSPHVQNLYDGLKTNLYLAVVDTASNSAKQYRQDNLAELLRQKRKDFKYAVYGGYVLMIMSTDYKTFNAKREFGNLKDCIEQENLLVGISSCFDNLFELHKYYIEGVEALKSLKKNSKKHISLYKKPAK